MQFIYSPYILPLLMAAVISTWVAFYAWQHRRASLTAPALGLMALVILEWSLGYALEIAGADLPTKIFWGKTQYIAIATIPLIWLIFAIQYTNPARRLTPRLLALVSFIPVVTILLAFTTQAHGLVWKEITLTQAGSLRVLTFSYGTWFWVHWIYSYILLLSGTILVVRGIGRMQGLYRGQVVALLVAVLAPWIGNALYLTGLNPFPHFDLTPFAFTITNVALAWGIFGFRLIDLSPLARDMVLDGMQDGMIVIDAQGLIADVNPAAQKLLQRPFDQIIGHSTADVFNNYPHIIERFRGTTDAHEEICLGKGPTRVWYDLNFSPLQTRQSTAQVIGRVVTIRDITQLKQADEQKQAFLQDMKALQEVHLKLSDIRGLSILYGLMVQLSQRDLGLEGVTLLLLDKATNTLVGTYGTDRQGNLSVQSDYREPIGPGHWSLELEQEPNRARLWMGAPAADPGRETAASWKAAATLWTGQQVMGYLVCDNRQTGKAPRPYETELISILGSTFGHLIEHKFAENELRKLSIAVKASPVSIMITDIQGNIEYVNPKFSEVTGYSAEEVLGKNPRLLKSDFTPPEVHREMWSTLKDKQEWRGEFCNRKKNGELFWEIASISPITDYSGFVTNYIAVKEDITVRKQNEDALAIARDQALEASRLKSQLLAKVSHELRTPLGGILGFAELLHGGYFGDLNEKQAEVIASLIESSHYLNIMINELLDQAQIEAKSVILHNNGFSPASLLQRIETSLNVIASRKDLAFTTHLHPDLPAELVGDEQRLQQILINLAGNALKFTQTGEVRVELKPMDETYWAMLVTDTGIGIPPEAQAYIFEPFRQVDTSITRENRGTGLGLSITKQLVDIMGGRILLESEVGKGSTFTVVLPMMMKGEKSS